MSSLSGCIKKAGAALSSSDKDAILARAAELRDSGASAQDAAVRAVSELMASVQALIDAAGAPKAAPSANTVFTEDAYQAARARLKAKLGRLNSGLDPEMMLDGITTAGYHVEKGARKFAAFARAMVDDLGDAVKPYLVGWYMATRADPRAEGFKADMEKASAVEDLDVDVVLATTDKPAAAPAGDTMTAEQAEAEVQRMLLADDKLRPFLLNAENKVQDVSWTAKPYMDQALVKLLTDGKVTGAAYDAVAIKIKDAGTRDAWTATLRKLAAVTQGTQGTQGTDSAIERPESDEDVTMSGDVLMHAEPEALDALLMADVAEDGERQRDVAMFGQQPKRVSLPRAKGDGKGGPLKLPPGVEVMTTEQAKEKLAEWKGEAERQGREESNYKYGVLSLFDTTGVMAQPWIDAGYAVYTYDLQDGQDINEFDAQNLLEQHGNDNIMVVIGQPPCTDFASSGAQWWKDKDAAGKTEASNELVRQVLRTVELFRPAVWAMENPVGRIATQNKLPKPTAAFDPWHFGDDYTKRTQFFGRFNPDMPTAQVFPARGSIIHKMSSSAQKERSDTPEGIAYAFFMANNFVGMGPAGRLASEFAGVDRALFDAAVTAGKTELQIRDAIDDPYYENDLETVRDELTAMGATTGPDTPATPGKDDTQGQEATNGQADQPGMGSVDTRGVRAPESRRGPRSQQPDAQLDFGDVAEGEPGNVAPAAGGTADGPAGIRAAGEDVGSAGGTDARGPARNRRKGAGRAGKPDAGTRGGNPGSAAGEPGTVDPETVSPANKGPGDFTIDDPLKVAGGGQVARFEKNKAAIELRNRLMDEGRKPTREEQAVLAGYTGWGSFGQEFFLGTWAKPAPKAGWEARDQWLRENLGQKDWEGMNDSIINAHYTDPPTVMAMWDMVRRLGFTGGRTLEPSIGIGNFYGLMPGDMTARSLRSGIELDPLTGSMAQMLYPDSNIHIKGYQESTTPDGFYDLVVGNWPFADISPADRRYNRLSPTLHDYFFLKAIDQTRPGGLIIGITSKGTMDKKGIGARVEMARKAELVAAFRLPSGAFEEYAGTKVVTDIIILRKREAPIGIVEAEGWIDTRDHATKEGTPVTVNEYFHAHPDHVIGEIDYGHGTASFRPGLIVHRPADMAAQLKRITSLVPEGVFTAGAAAKQIRYVSNHTSDRTNALTKTGKGFFVVRGEHLAPANEVQRYEVKSEATNAKREAELGALIDMRRLYGALIDAEQSGEPEPHRKALRKAYEAFVKAHGQLSESFGLGYLRKLDDPFYPSLAGLEVRTEDAKGKASYRPAAILSASTMRGKVSIDNPTITDAFVLARNDSVNPSIERIAELAKTTPAEVRASLIESGAGFEMPNGDFAPSDMYLSGNVRDKMRDAAAALAEGNKAMQRNVDALTKVMPKDIPYYTIETQMGATWVPPAIYGDFVAHMLGLPDAKDIEVTFSGGAWRIDFDSALNHRNEARSGYGSANVPFKRLVRAAVANQTITIKYKDDGKEYVDEERTKEVNAKIADMRLKFGEWLWKEPTRRVQLEREYNEVRNSYADAQFDGSFLRFQGMALSLGRGPFSLRQHQINAIWRALVTRKSLNAHEVGTGKTFTMGGIAVESRRYGIAKKPLLFAHNANSKSVAAEIQMMYPAAKVLYVDNLSKENVKTRLMQIANDDWDVVVMPHSIIDRIGFKKETLMGMAKEEISDLEIAAQEAAADDNDRITDAMWDDEEELKKLRSPTAKQLVKTRMRIVATIEKLSQQASKEGAVSFEDLGVDMVLVDEAHEFKKPPIATKMKMKGLQTQVSGRSIAMMFLTKYVRAMNNGGNVHLFTGTPITNTMTEVFHMMRYMMQEEMKTASLADWDGWFGSFAREVNDVELSSTGEYEAVTRLQSFINVPELRRMIGQYMDVVFSDDMPEMKPRSVNGKTMADRTLTEDERNELLNGRTPDAQDRPYKKVINESSDMTPAQVRVFEQVQKWSRSFKAMRKKERREVMQAGRPESPIVHDGIAARASFDVRLVDAIENAGKEGAAEMLPHPDSKPARVLKNLLALYRGDDVATQVVFMEQGISKSVTRREGPIGQKRDVTYPAFSTMHDMVDRLVAAGVPREQIAMVDGSTSKDKRKEVADGMNSGKIRIVFGSTDSLGVGVNMQKNLRAMHHMDAPWMPGELEQRNGRGHRQGNQWNTVLEYRYLTDRLDGRRWQVLAIKQRFITSFMKSKGEERVIEGDAAAEDGGDIMSTFAEAAGDPRILLAEKYKKKVEQLQSRERIHSQAVVDALREIQSSDRAVDGARRTLEALKRAGTKDKIAAFVAAQLGDGFRASIDGVEFTSRADLAAHMAPWIKTNLRAGDEFKEIGTYGGQKLHARWYKWSSSPDLLVTVAGEEISSNGPSVASLDAGLRSARDTIESEQEQYIESGVQRGKHARTVADEPFHLQGKLSDAKKQLYDLQRDIAANPVAPPYWLRNGAPVDTEVMADGQVFVVNGHRWSADGYFILARDAKGQNVIPYMDVTDSQGMALYEEHEFKAPVVADREVKAGALMLDKDGRKWTVVRVTDQDGIKLVLAKNERGEQHELRTDSLTFAPEAKPADETLAEPTNVDLGEAELSAEREQAQMDAWQKETGAITPMFSRSQGQQQPASDRRKAVEALVALVAARWVNAPEVVVVDSLDDPRVPEAVRRDEQTQQSKADVGAPEGFFHDGKVYLVAPQLRGDADVIRVLFHETLGHFGLRGTFGPSLGTILDRVAVLNAAKVRAKAKQYGLDYDKPSDRRAAAEEVLAEMAQRTPNIGWGAKAVAAVRTWLRLHVPGFRKMALSDAELVRSYILPARAFVQRGGPAGGPGGGVRFSRVKTLPAATDTKRYQNLKWEQTSDDMQTAELGNGWVAAIVQNEDGTAELTTLLPNGADFGRAITYDHVGMARLAAPGVLARQAIEDGTQPGDSAAHIFKGAPDDGAMFSRASITDAVRNFNQVGARNAFLDAVTTHGSTNLWHRTVGTQYHKAQANPETFGPVFDGVQDYIKDTSVFANQAADLAPSLLPKMETWRDVAKGGLLRHGADQKDTAKAGEAIFQGTLDKVLYDDATLASRFGLTALQVGLYHEFRAAVDQSLVGMAKTEILRLAGKDGLPVRNAVLEADSARAAADIMGAHLADLAEQTADDNLLGTVEKIGEKVDRIEQLQGEGYAPLMRFGKHTLHITRPDGGTEFFGMYETVRDANIAARQLRGDPVLAGMDFKQGVMSQEGHKLFSGLSLDSLELFADATGNDNNPVYQAYLKLAMSNRSAMKRMIERKNIAGYSDDVARVLASFVTSNARMSAGNLHLNDAKKAAEAIPKEQGDLRDDAINLVEYVTNPAEEAAAVRGLLFTTFIGGSVASALVNLTQPVTMTYPYLVQFGGAAKALKRMTAALAMVASGKGMDTGLAAALARAEQDGIVSPQEIHHLQGAAMGKLTDWPILKKAAFIWGSMFSLAEQFNRRVSFVAAYQTAQQEGMANPFKFAEQAVVETQGLYNKGNKANLARGAVGATVMTFKQFSTHYLEFLVRMWKSGPEGKKAVGVALALLMLTAGAGGLPFADDLDDLIDTLGQAMGHDTNSKRWKRQFIAQTLGMGDTAAEIGTRGLTALPGFPVDLSLRMGLGNLLPATGLFLRSNTDTARQLLEVAGAAGGLAANIKDGVGKALGGDAAGGAMTAMPVAVQNMAKAVQMWDTGEYRNKKGAKVIEVDAVDGAMKFIGFQPAAVARESNRVGETMRTVQLAKNVEGEIAGRWAQAMADGDSEGVAKAKQTLADWNADNPKAPIKITLTQVLARVKALKTSRADRTIKSAPKELRPLVRETLN